MIKRLKEGFRVPAQGSVFCVKMVCIVSEIKGLIYDYHPKGLNFFSKEI